MKNQFVGDINDYFKYGLLRILSGFGKKKIGVCWMLTPDGDSRAGGLTGYLNNRNKWRDYDPDVFDALHKIVLEDPDRRVKRIEEAGILPSACFFDRPLEEVSEHRKDYFNEMFHDFSGVDLVFFDPDTGLVPPTRATDSERRDKWLYFGELTKAFRRGHSVLVIQFTLFKKPNFVRRKVDDIWKATLAPEIYSFSARNNVHFFLAVQQKHIKYFRQQAQRVRRSWKNRLEPTRHDFGERRNAAGTKDLGSDTAKAAGSVYSLSPLPLDGVRTYPLRSRKSKVSVKNFARAPRARATMAGLLDSLPRILAGNDFRAVIEALRRARGRRKPIIWGLGGHVIKCGLSPVLIDLMRRGYLTAVAMNGAALIHDFEIALAGATSEDVPAVLGRGRFGMAEETGRYINEAISIGDAEGSGIGEAVGRFLTRYRGARFRRYSLLAAAYRARMPVTVHVAIGTDIIHNHPAMDARATGAATHRDFRLLAALVRRMDGGGVYLNVGSAVVLPEIFLKCVSLAANLGRAPRGITTVNMDFIQHYRPMQNVVLRPTKMGRQGGRGASHGYALTGHHEVMIPLLAAALADGKRGR